MRRQTKDALFLALAYMCCAGGVVLAYTLGGAAITHLTPSTPIGIQDARAYPPKTFPLVGHIAEIDNAANALTVRTRDVREPGVYHNIRINLTPDFYTEYRIYDDTDVIIGYNTENQPIGSLPIGERVWLSYYINRTDNEFYSDGISF